MKREIQEFENKLGFIKVWMRVTIALGLVTGSIVAGCMETLTGSLVVMMFTMTLSLALWLLKVVCLGISRSVIAMADVGKKPSTSIEWKPTNVRSKASVS